MYTTTRRFIAKTDSLKNSHKLWQIVQQFLPEFNRRFYALQRDKNLKTIRRYRPTKAIRICTGRVGKTGRNCNDNSTFNVYNKTSTELAIGRENITDNNESEDMIVAKSDTNAPMISDIPDSELQRGVYNADANAYEQNEIEEILNRRQKMSEANIDYQLIKDQETEHHPKVNLEAAVLSSKKIHAKDQSMDEFITNIFNHKSNKSNATVDNSKSQSIEHSEQLYFPSDHNPYHITITNNMTKDTTDNSSRAPFAVNVFGAKEVSRTEMEGKANAIKISVTDTGLDIRLMLSYEDKLSESKVDENQQPKLMNMENAINEEESDESLSEDNQQRNESLFDRNPSGDELVQNVILNNSVKKLEPLDDEYQPMESTKTKQNQQRVKAIKLNSFNEDPGELFTKTSDEPDSIYQRVLNKNQQPKKNIIYYKDEKHELDQKQRITRFKKDIYEINHSDQYIARKEQDLTFLPIKNYFNKQHKIDSTEKTKSKGSTISKSSSSKPTRPPMHGFSSANANVPPKSGQSSKLKGGSYSIPMHEFYAQLEVDGSIPIFGGNKKMKQRLNQTVYSDSERKVENSDSKKVIDKKTGKITNETNDENIDESLLEYKEKYAIDNPKSKPQLKKVEVDEDDDEKQVKRELLHIPDKKKKEKKLFAGIKNMVSFIFTTDEPPKKEK